MTQTSSWMNNSLLSTMYYILFIFTPQFFCVPCTFVIAEFVDIDHRWNEIHQAYFSLVPWRAYEIFSMYQEEQIWLYKLILYEVD